MSRVFVVSNVLWVLVVAALSWTLYARTGEGSAASEPVPAGESGRMAVSASAIDADTANRLADQLSRIDARLAALERAASGEPPIAPTVQMSASEADRRLRAMLPGPEIDPGTLMRFQADMAAHSPAERYALSTALSRAINEDRLRLRQ